MWQTSNRPFGAIIMKVSGPRRSIRAHFPFRVKQIFETMVDYVSQGQVTKYICAAGILAHYVGDACQPLNGSRLHDAQGVHSPYETKMLNFNRGANGVVAKIRAALVGHTADSNITTGTEAARRTIEMMRHIRNKHSFSGRDPGSVE